MQVLRIAKHFWGAQDELFIEACNLMGDQACVPPELLYCTLADLHWSQQGMEKMQAQAREGVYWPGINADIADYVRRYTICTKHKGSLPAEPMLPWNIPEYLWQITADYFHHKGKECLLICNLFSKYPFLFQVTSKSAHFLSQKLQELISPSGPPSHIYIDNGPPFVSNEFMHFLQWQHIDHTTSSPHFLQLKWFIERQVKTIKTALSTTQDAGKSIEDLLWDLQSTPIGPKMPSPRDILQNRMIQYPGKPSTPVDMEHICNHLLAKKKNQKQFFNRAHNAKPMTQLDPSQEVLFLSLGDQSTYIPSTIVNKAYTQQNYHIEAQGKQYHRTWEHIWLIQQDIFKYPIYEPEPQNPKPSHMPKPSLYSRAHPQPIHHQQPVHPNSKLSATRASHSHIPRQWQ